MNITVNEVVSIMLEIQRLKLEQKGFFGILKFFTIKRETERLNAILDANEAFIEHYSRQIMDEVMRKLNIDKPNT